MTGRLFLMVAIVVVVGGRADAQEPGSDLSQLQGLVKAGDTLTVTDTGGQRMTGKVAQVDASGIVLERKTPNWLRFTSNKQVRRFDTQMVDAIAQRESLGKGAGIGMVSGGIFGAVGSALVNDDDPYAVVWATMNGALYALIGGAIGATIDYFIGPRQHLIYAKSKATVSVQPEISRDRKAVMVTVLR